MVHTLTGQIALVTGASRGIGRAIALTLARAGAVVVGTATRQSGAMSIGEDLAAHGLAGCGRILDVNDVALNAFDDADERRRLGCGHQHQSELRVPALAGGAASDAQGALWAHDEYHFCRWRGGQCGSGELCGCEGGGDGNDARPGARSGGPRNYGELCCTGFYRYGYDARADGRTAQCIDCANTGGSLWPSGRRRAFSGFSGVRAGGLYYRRNIACEWRNVHELAHFSVACPMSLRARASGNLTEKCAHLL